MKRYLIAAVLGLCAALCMGCIDNYETREAGGKLYRINKRTGDIDLVDGKSMIRIHGAAPRGRLDLPPDEAARSGESRGNGAEGKMHRTLTDERTIAKYRKAGGSAYFFGGGEMSSGSFPLRCRLPAGTQVDGWFYNGGDESDQSNWIPDTALSDKQIEAQPWKLFVRPRIKSWAAEDDDTLTSY
ncbi:MAG: hypothetical protein JW699_04990 [Chitinispirillaceae bacterium]|nr:hypothetical protein [Chitinispirillaceae bacterium]